MEVKRCNSCSQTKSVKQFNKRGDSFSSDCKECIAYKRRLKKDTLKAKLKENPFMAKTCKVCNEHKKVKDFSLGYSTCKECVREKSNKNIKKPVLLEKKKEKEGNLESIFEMEERTKVTAKLSLEELKVREKEQLKKGLKKWVWEQRQYGKVRVLRSVELLNK